MNKEIMNQISEIFKNVFKYYGDLTLETKRTDIPEWDSLQHVALVETIENTFNIHLSMDEMIEMQSVIDIINILSRHGIS
jgi:acyl carrier protein